MENLLFLRKCDILIQVRKLYRKLTENRDLSIIEEPKSLPELLTKLLSFWKISCLPTKIQLVLLEISNHQLKLNNQLKHYAVDEAVVRVKPECTICILGQSEPVPPESYTHFFLE